jgi:hypothetical protein
MQISLSTFKTAARTTLVAGAFAASVLATPTTTLAQPNIELNFGVPGLSFGFGNGNGSITLGFGCSHRLSRDEIRRGLRRADFEDIEFVSFSRSRAVVEAEWDEDNEEYRIRIDRCTGEASFRRLD